MIGDALRVLAFCDSYNLVRHLEHLLLHDLEITDYVHCRLRGDESKLVELVVLEELVGDLDDALASVELARKVDTYGDLVLYTLEIEDVQGLVYVFGRDMVQYGAILQCAYY